MRGANVTAAIEKAAFSINASRQAAVLTMNNMPARRQVTWRRASKAGTDEDSITPVNSTHKNKEEAPAADWF
jgi:hypothetical protein